jgi:uncharacterized protein (TIRG00374 family)
MKAAGCLACIAWLARTVRWPDVGAALREAELGWILLSLTLAPLLLLAGARKWQLLLRARGNDPGLVTCFRLYTVGYFFNNFLPSNVGGDVARVYLLVKRGGSTAEALASVFVERFTGLTALVALAAAAALTGPAALYHLQVRLFIGAVVVGYAMLLGAVLQPGVARFVQARLPGPLGAKLVRLHDAIAAYRGHPSVLLVSLALSVLFYAGAALNIYAAMRAFGAPLQLLDAAFATPLILLVAAVPIAIGGIGLQEGSMVAALGVYGVPAAVALTGALLIRVKGMLVGALGVLWMGFGNSRFGIPQGTRLPLPEEDNLV